MASPYDGFRKADAQKGRRRGFATFDLLFAAIPVVMIVSNLLLFSHIADSEASAKLELLSTERRLLSVSDYVVSYAAAEKNTGTGYSASYKPNLITNSGLASLDENSLAESAGLSSLYVGWDEGEGTCIYRIVLHEDKIEKLHFCGEAK